MILSKINSFKKKSYEYSPYKLKLLEAIHIT